MTLVSRADLETAAVRGNCDRESGPGTVGHIVRVAAAAAGTAAAAIAAGAAAVGAAAVGHAYAAAAAAVAAATSVADQGQSGLGTFDSALVGYSWCRGRWVSQADWVAWDRQADQIWRKTHKPCTLWVCIL